MKKTIFILTILSLFFFVLVVPVLAKKNTIVNAASVYAPRAVSAWGEITTISAKILPADVTIKISKIAPTKLKNFPGTYPAKDSVVVLHLTGDTKVVRKYLGKADFSELAVGDKVDAVGKLQADGTVNSTIVKDNGIHVTFNAKKGEVMAIDAAAKTFIIKNEKKEFKIYVTDATKFAKLGLEKPTLADLKVGDEVNVRGVIRQAVNEVTADSVVIKIGQKEIQVKQLEQKKAALEKNLEKMKAEIEVIIKKINELKNAVVTPTP